MKYDYCSTPYNQLADAWNMFVDTGTIHKGVPRPDEYTSWIRCRHEHICGPIVPLQDEEIAKKYARNNHLLSNSKKVIGGINSILTNVLKSNYAVILMDAEGLIIDIVCRARETIPLGDRCNEIYACYNAIDISSHEKKALEVYNYQHLYPRTDDWHTIGDPILNYDKSVAGGLGVVAEIASVSSIVPIVKIGSQLIRSSLVFEQIARNNISMLLEEIPEPVIAINNCGIIMNANQETIDYMKLPRDLLIGQKISNYLVANVDYNELYSYSNGFYVFNNVSICIGGKIHNTMLKKSIMGSFNGHPLILISFQNKRFKTIGSLANLSNHQLYKFDDLVGESYPIRKVKDVAGKAARSVANILIEGESGTGKELIAQSIHTSSRPQGPFVALNCGAFTKDLLQSELFGYEEGAFTGAKKGGKPGKFEIADGGTLFLDEIGEMPMDMQVSLLRCLQDKTVTRVGGTEAKKVDLRIIAATNQNLYKQVKEGNFREDLYYRLNVIELKMPSLRERKQDLPLLVKHILNQLGEEYNTCDHIELSDEAMDCLRHYDWPGNVRELKNVLERAIIYSDGIEINADCLPEHIREGKPKLEGPDILREYEKMAIAEVLARNKGNISKTAEELGMARSTLYQKIEKLNIPH